MNKISTVFVYSFIFIVALFIGCKEKSNENKNIEIENTKDTIPKIDTMNERKIDIDSSIIIANNQLKEKPKKTQKKFQRLYIFKLKFTNVRREFAFNIV